jgi:hypothetical protein
MYVLEILGTQSFSQSEARYYVKKANYLGKSPRIPYIFASLRLTNVFIKQKKFWDLLYIKLRHSGLALYKYLPLRYSDRDGALTSLSHSSSLARLARIA